MSVFGWFDFVVIGLLVFGLFRGRKRGMSMELLSVLQVLIMVVVGAQVYQFLGQKLNQVTSGTIGMLLCYVIAYVGFAMIVYMIFSRIRTAVGEKLVGSDVFGRMEYYFGMLSGVIRYTAIVVMFLALMHARPIDYKAEEQYQKSQQKELGSDFFPSFGTVQIQLFDNSMTGKFVKRHLDHLLIKPSAGGPAPAPKRETIGKQKQRALDEVLEQPKKH